MVSRDQWLLFPRSNPQARIRLFCFPYAGGGSAVYRRWPAELPGNIEVGLIQLPGRETRLREKPLTEITYIIEHLAQSLRPYLDKPFAFFGHSMGAIISFELARHLRWVHQVEPERLFVSGRRAPQLPISDPIIYDLPDQEFLAEIIRLNGTPITVLENQELMRLMLPLLRADFTACQTYRYVHEPPLQCPITAFGGLEDAAANRERLDAWRAQTMNSFSLFMLPGDHFFIKTTKDEILPIVGKTLSLEGAMPMRFPN
ncbi:MAG TPA: thioesterase domain-containing protein [Blastocatellia bacterium]|nr:thioesterase domain-containing protein [Blastocatellia bacterium]